MEAEMKITVDGDVKEVKDGDVVEFLYFMGGGQ
jgi:hypothetical protein